MGREGWKEKEGEAVLRNLGLIVDGRLDSLDLQTITIIGRYDVGGWVGRSYCRTCLRLPPLLHVAPRCSAA